MFNRTAIATVALSMMALSTPANATTTSRYILESSSTYGAVGSHCSAALFNAGAKAHAEAEQRADVNLSNTCDANHLSDSTCRAQCQNRGYMYGFADSVTVTYNMVNENPYASCGYFAVYSAIGTCGCYCWSL